MDPITIFKHLTYENYYLAYICESVKRPTFVNTGRDTETDRKIVLLKP